jgi:telomerase reverse transcriptase
LPHRRDHLFKHIVVASGVKGSATFFHQTEGIAQGSVLSSMLCNVYYGSIEKKLLSGIFDAVDDEHPRLLVRVVDDFLAVTTKKEQCAEFLRIMTAGDKSLGVEINPAKTKINFDLPGHEANRIPPGSGFPWCGMIFDTATFATRIDYSDRFSGTKVSHRASRERQKRNRFDDDI